MEIRLCYLAGMGRRTTVVFDLRERPLGCGWRGLLIREKYYQPMQGSSVRILGLTHTHVLSAMGFLH